MTTCRSGALRTLALALGALASAQFQPSARADEDGYKLYGRAPIYRGPGLHGVPVPSRDGRAGPFEGDGITLMSWIPLGDFPGDQTSSADCWGYVSASGREYAIIGLRDGTSFVEVTDPANPVQVAYVTGPGSLWHDSTVIGDFAYLASEGGSGIQVVDLTRIDEGTVRHVQDRTEGGHRTTHTILSNPESGYLYLCGANIANGGLVAVSTADPENPKIAGAWSQHYVHEAQIVNYHDGPYAGREIAFCFSARSSMDIVDVTDKSDMRRIGALAYEGLKYCHQGWITDDKRYLYLNDELDEGRSTPVTTTRVIDITDLAHPFVASTFSTGLAATDHNLYVKGNLLFESNYRSGVHVFDISADPLNPTRIAHLDTYPGSDAPGYDGVWGNFPFFPSGTFILSDLARGLFVLRLGDSSLEFDLPAGAPRVLSTTQVTPVSLRIAEHGLALDPASVQAHVSFDASTPVDISLEPAEDGLFRGDLPSGPCLASADIWFTARATDGRTFTYPFVPEEPAFRADVAAALFEILSDDFQTDRGWTSSGDSLTDGAWERAVPLGGADGAPDADFDHSGECFLTGNALGSEVDGGTARLTSPRLDLSGYPETRISYARWYATDLFSFDSTFVVDVSNDDGAEWTRLEWIGRAASWQAREFRISDVITPTDAVRVRFAVRDVGTGSMAEAALDAFRVWALTCSDCRPDFDGDGRLTINDFIAFQSAWRAQEPRADFDSDGRFTVNDFIAYHSAFHQGC